VRAHLLLVAAVALLAAGPAVFTTARTLDDQYVLENARAGSWFAYSVECPGPECTTAWWNAPPYRRHFIRFLPSLLLRAAVAPNHPVVLRCFGLVLHLCDSLLLFALLTILGVPGATLAAALFAAHPAGTELAATPSFLCVGVAGLFVLLTLLAWSRRRAALCLVFCFAALTSYEATVLLPLLLFALPRRTRWRPIAACALLVPYFLLRWLLHAHDIARPLGTLLVEGLRLGVRETVGYLVATFSLMSWDAMSARWLEAVAGEIGAPLVAVAAIVVVVLRTRGNALARAGLIAFAAFLLPPVLVRATVGVFNSPTLRQLYLPLLGAALVVGATVESPRARTIGWCVVAFFVACSWRLGVVIDRGGVAAFSAAVKRELAGTSAGTPVAWIGQPARYHVNFDWPERRQELLIPPPLDDGELRLCRGDSPHELVAVAPAGFVGQKAPAHGGVDFLAAIWVTPEVFRTGSQRLSLGRVESDGLALRYHLDRDVDEIAFLRSRRGGVARLRPQPCHDWSGGSSK
jgi:hypothetical protein